MVKKTAVEEASKREEEVEIEQKGVGGKKDRKCHDLEFRRGSRRGGSRYRSIDGEHGSLPAGITRDSGRGFDLNPGKFLLLVRR